MKLVSFAIKSAFLTGALAAGAFITGATVGMLVNKEKVVNTFPTIPDPIRTKLYLKIAIL